jgi:curved DNA-binding protein CbpA
MDEPLPDHYKALGLDRSADAATIKATYRKLVLKCHPDKVTDPTLKEQKQNEFHQIQQAYEALGSDEKRAAYEDELKLEKLRKERSARLQREKTARFDVRTAGGASFTANGPSRYSTEERKPSKHDDRYFEDRARNKYETYDAYPPKSGAVPRSSREKESSSRSTRPSTTDRTRSEKEKARAKDSRTDRKFVAVDSDSDDKARYEAEYKKRSADEEARRQAAEAMRKAEERRTYEDNRYAGATAAPASHVGSTAPPPSYAGSTAVPAHRKMSAQEQEALRYQHKSRAQVEDEMARPSPIRTSSRDYYAPESRSSRREVRPEPVRRSSARPTKERPSMSSRRETDRNLPEVVEWAEERHSEERRPPMFKTSSSSPAEFARMMPQRSYTESSSHHRHAENSPPPSFHRSATMPSAQHSSSRRKESAAPRPSGLRETMTPSGSPERDAFPTVPPAQPSSANKTTYYRYPVAAGGVPVRPEEVPRHTVFREPGQRHRSPSPIGKPPIGANRPAENPSTYKPTAPRPSMGSRTESSRNISPVRGSEDRGRSGRPKLYGEVSNDTRRSGRQSSYSPSEVQYTRKYGPEDVRWAPRSGETERDRYASKPTLGRTATYVY